MRLKIVVLVAVFLAWVSPIKAGSLINWTEVLTPLFKNLLLCTVGNPQSSTDWHARETACNQLKENKKTDRLGELIILSLFQRDRGETALSEKSFNEAVRLDKRRVAEFTANIAFALNDKDISAKIGHYPAAVALRFADLAVKADPTFMQGHYEKANTLQRQKKHADAVASYSAAIRLSPNNAAAYKGRALSLMVLGDQSAAQADISKAASLEVAASEKAKASSK